MTLNSAERRGALVVLLLLAIGAGYDLWRALGPRAAPPAAAERARDSAAVGAAAADSAAPDSTPRSGGGPVLDLNRAGADELDALPGIGPVLARRILEHRRRNGPFRRIEELRAVRGVGPRLLARLRPRVSVGAPEAPAR
ncbi:MAG TPA: helix-hairpin-helix domain-containing protein [Candidatus Eisenbacteria bacterium]